ncbi:hypothetical protein ACIRVK_42140 [Streptomyces sp. NPDC101152]|uniref:hypothetical protein n=1 Tax=Streptomyces sp. NPDC101152 TaxID=3366116 RepID=UPI0037F5C4BC
MGTQIRFTPQTLWALAVLCAAVTGTAYEPMSRLERFATPWAAGGCRPRRGAGRGHDC